MAEQFIKSFVIALLAFSLAACQRYSAEDAIQAVSDDSGFGTIERFSEDSIALWNERSFKGNTDYQVAVVEGRPVLRASAEGTASLLFKQQRIAVNDFPLLQWKWRIQPFSESVIRRAEENFERTRAGDDFAARVYVVYQAGFLPNEALAINYVWSANQPVGASWPNPFNKNAMMLVVASGNEDAGSWRILQRNVKDDYKKFFDLDIDRLDGYALMVDGDNTGTNATAWFEYLGFKESGE